MLSIKMAAIIGGVSLVIIGLLVWQLSNRIEEVGQLRGALDGQKKETTEAVDANKENNDEIDKLVARIETMVAERKSDQAETQKLLEERDRRIRLVTRERNEARRDRHDTFDSTESCKQFTGTVVRSACPIVADELRQRPLDRSRSNENSNEGRPGGSGETAPIEPN